jgi:hypothetical protein
LKQMFCLRKDLNPSHHTAYCWIKVSSSDFVIQMPLLLACAEANQRVGIYKFLDVRKSLPFKLVGQPTNLFFSRVGAQALS